MNENRVSPAPWAAILFLLQMPTWLLSIPPDLLPVFGCRPGLRT